MFYYNFTVTNPEYAEIDLTLYNETCFSNSEFQDISEQIVLEVIQETNTKYLSSLPIDNLLFKFQDFGFYQLSFTSFANIDRFGGLNHIKNDNLRKLLEQKD